MNTLTGAILLLLLAVQFYLWLRLYDRFRSETEELVAYVRERYGEDLSGGIPDFARRYPALVRRLNQLLHDGPESMWRLFARLGRGLLTGMRRHLHHEKPAPTEFRA
ncbi:MAG: hypothetical protein PHE83_16595 [Opitutaceae bacterium]|nr:hypothetical protein [Opitutaceae bacterium]